MKSPTGSQHPDRQQLGGRIAQLDISEKASSSFVSLFASDNSMTATGNSPTGSTVSSPKYQHLSRANVPALVEGNRPYIAAGDDEKGM
jgi:hypothetical protein